MEVVMSESSHERGISRRSFVAGVVGFLGGIIAVIIGIPAIGYIISPSLKKEELDAWVPLGPVEELPLNEPNLFTFTRTKQVGWERSAISYGIYVTRLPGNEYFVFSNECTHLSCRVTWQEPPQNYICPCHDGRFAEDGSIISGPQPRPLDEYAYKIEDGIMLVHLEEV
jgi:menaquinol-cytochrome c reductase iron-sulfur subunit